MNIKKHIRSIVFCILSLVAAGSLYAQTSTVLHLWPINVPGETLAKKEATVKNDTAKHIVRVTDVTDPLLKIFKAPTFNNNGGAIIICPGGGFKFLAWDLEGEEIAGWLNSLGFSAFVLQYRVPNKQAGALQDAQRAIRMVRQHAADFGIDTARIGIIGFSAGANIAARASTNFKKNTYPAVDAADSLSCRPAFSLYIYPGSLSTGEDRHVIPEINVDSIAPPAFFFAADDDQYNFPYAFVSALHYAKVAVELHVVPKGGHGYGLRQENPAAEVWPQLAKTWLQQFSKPVIL